MFPGRIITDRYRVLRVLGRGGMGVVCEVESLQTLERFAIKFLRQDVETDMQPNARFLREAKLATHLRSPHSCRVISVGEWELGPYIVMELLSGCALSALLEGGRKLAWTHAVRIAYEICGALAEAHHLNIVHRDIKPGNVFLSSAPDQSVVTKVLDFGVAKIPGTVVTHHGERSLTDASTVIGTPSYVAPEQLMNSKQVDARADIWAVGVMLYEMLAGQLPFNSPLVPKLLLMIARDEPTSLFELDIEPELPLEIVQITECCLAKDPNRRYANAEQLAAALEPWLNRQPNLLVDLIPQASQPKLDLHLDGSEYPAEFGDHRKPADSLGPHTTAGFPKRRHLNLASLRTLSAGVALGALVALSYYFLAGKQSARGTDLASRPQPATTNREPQPKPLTSANAGSEMRRLSVEAIPPHARLQLDGVAVPENPWRTVNRDDGMLHELTITAPGFIGETRQIRFDKDQAHTIVLRPIALGAPSAAPRSTSTSGRPPRTTTPSTRQRDNPSRSRSLDSNPF